MVFWSVKFSSMTNIASKVIIVVGVISILVGAVFLGLDPGNWATYIYSILLGICFTLLGISFILGGIGQKVTRRLSFGFIGAALVFLGFSLAQLD
jgi:uncharacterized membrane protein HdeD (DUF308 family)